MGNQSVTCNTKMGCANVILLYHLPHLYLAKSLVHVLIFVKVKLKDG